MTGYWRCIGFLVVVLSVDSPGNAVERGFIDKFCIDAPHDRLCSVLPFDQTDFSSDFDYLLIEKGAQDPFDVFSWQAFVALNWPASHSGTPRTETIGDQPDAPRVWQSFARRSDIFGPDPAWKHCGEHISGGALLIEDMMQSDGSVLVDRNGSFAFYTTYANPVVESYIRENGLTNASGQHRLSATGNVAFPRGRLADKTDGRPASPPSITLKMAWRIMGSGEEHEYLTRPGVVFIPPPRTTDGEPLCVKAKLGLVGMHIAIRTQSGNGSEWIWATFEHIANAPVAKNARNVNSIYTHDLFPDGCAAPERKQETTFAFFDATCRDCSTNARPASDWRWSSSAPHARDSKGVPLPRTQAVRCWDIFESTAEVNRLWQTKLKGTVFANYMLISTQWRGTEPNPLFEHGEVPRYLTNVALETYQQFAKNGTCLGCHATAETVAGTPADFVFMLRRAAPERRNK